LGLPLVRAIIEKHGGIVVLRSRPDQGTVFSVRLPAI
jgi:signal transduction histidine kinase